MITPNEKNHLPEAFQWYLLCELGIVASVILIFASIFDQSLGIAAFWLYSIFIIIPGLAYFRIYNHFFSFIVDGGKITINSGILVKRSKSISLSAIQNVENKQGLFQRAFKLSTMSIWTASPSQIAMIQSNTIPDVQLILDSEDAEWLKNYVIDNGGKNRDV